MPACVYTVYIRGELSRPFVVILVISRYVEDSGRKFEDHFGENYKNRQTTGDERL